MSAESLRAQLDQTAGAENDFMAVRKGDVRLALDVIEAAKNLLSPFHKDRTTNNLQAALDAFEAAP